MPKKTTPSPQPEPPGFNAFKAAFTTRYPLRAAHKSRLPGIMLHHTTQMVDDLDSADYYKKAWRAGIWLAAYIEKHPDEFKGRRVVDIGAGSGLVAIAAARAGADVTAIDRRQEAVYAARLNAEANGVTIKTLKAGCPDFNRFHEFDIVTTTDTMYITDVRKAIIQMVKHAPLTVYISDQSGFADREDVHGFQAKIEAGGAHFGVIKMAKRFPSDTARMNSNSVTALKIAGRGGRLDVKKRPR